MDALRKASSPTAPFPGHSPARLLGQLTFEAEGTEGGRFDSRRASKPPGQSSGITIGRGYDMGRRTQRGVLADLLTAGLPAPLAEQLSQAAGLRGRRAEEFLLREGKRLPRISVEEQRSLFLAVSYPAALADVQRICKKPDVVARFGATDWDRLDPRIKEVLVDLRFRGDYTPATRTLIQRSVATNDLAGFRHALADRNFWIEEQRVPLDRFARRTRVLE